MATWNFSSETQTLDEQARLNAPGSFVKLTDGFTHYELSGPEDGQVVVLIHGFSVPYFVWDATFAPLVEAGLRVLRYDLFGRGWSDRPDTRYDHTLFTRQLNDLITTLGITSPVDLVGLSMGGAITATFNARQPDRVRRIVLIDPAGFRMKKSVVMRLLSLPWLGEWLLDRFGDPVLVYGQQADFLEPQKANEYLEKYKDQMRLRGFKRAILSTLRCRVIEDAEEEFHMMHLQPKPVLLIWGKQDTTVPFRTSQRALQIIPNAEFHPIDNARHVPHIERPESVNPILIEYLTRQ